MGCGTSAGLDLAPRPEPLPQDLADYVDEALERLDRDEAVIPCEQTGGFHGNSTGSMRGFSSGEAKRKWFEVRIQQIKDLDCNIIDNWMELDADFTVQHGRLAGAAMPPYRKMQAKVQDAQDAQTALYSKLEARISVYRGAGLDHLKQMGPLWPDGFSRQELKEFCVQPEEAHTATLTYAAGVKRLELLYEFTARIARAVGLEPAGAVTWHVKRPLRLWRKAQDNFPHEAALNDFRHSTDVYRTSIAAKVPVQIEALLSLLKCAGRDAPDREENLAHLGIRKQDQFVVERIQNRFARPAPGGYMDAVVNVRINGYVFELQLHLAELLALRGDEGRALAKWFKEFRAGEDGTRAFRPLAVAGLHSAGGNGGQAGATGPFTDGGTPGIKLGETGGGGRYSGPFLGGKRHGQGTLSYNSGDRYEGEFMFGLKQGTGTYFYAHGDRYRGDFMEDRMHGHGTYHSVNGECYEGAFDGGTRHGRGTFYGNDSAPFEGLWWQNKRMTIENV